jgi:hypothetical protein
MSTEKESFDLFDQLEAIAAEPVRNPKEWESEWQGMPEFVQGRTRPYSTLIVRFDSEEDLQEFAQIISQKLTSKTKSIWHPQIRRGIHSDNRYVDEP